MRRLIVTLVLCVSYASTVSADPGQLFQKFFGAVEQLQQYDAQRQQRRRAKVQRLMDACRKYKERACQAIIRAKGMPAAANFIAFVISYELELRRGDAQAARNSYKYALRWAKRMPNRKEAVRALREIRASLKAAPGSRAAKAKGDVVCDAAAPVTWRQACLKARKGSKGARLHRQLTELLHSRGTTHRQVLQCDALMQQQEREGLACFRSEGLSGEVVQQAQVAALEFELLVDSYIAD